MHQEPPSISLFNDKVYCSKDIRVHGTRFNELRDKVKPRRLS